MTYGEFPHKRGKKAVTQGIIDPETTFIQIHIILTRYKERCSLGMHGIEVMASCERVEKLVVRRAKVIGKATDPTEHMGVKIDLLS